MGSMESNVIETAKGILDTYITDCTEISWREFGVWDSEPMFETEIRVLVPSPDPIAGWQPPPPPEQQTTPHKLGETLNNLMSKHGPNAINKDGTMGDSLLEDVMGELAKRRHGHQVTCVSCKCQMKVITDTHQSHETLANSLLSQGWTSMLGLGWKCPVCSGNAKSWDSIWNV